MIPLVYATAPRRRQERLAHTITDLHLLRFLPDLHEDLGPAEQHDAVVERIEELDGLMEPFGRGSDGEMRVGGWPGTEILVDLADFLRQHSGEPALLGDICLVQADVRVSAALLRPLLGMDLFEYDRRTDWLGLVSGIEGREEFSAAEAGIRQFHSTVREICRSLLAESDPPRSADPADEEADRQLALIAEICTARAAAFDRRARATGRYLPLVPAPKLTLVGGVPVPVSWASVASNLFRGGRRRSDPETRPVARSRRRRRPM